MNDLTRPDVHALLTALRDGLRADGYLLELVAVGPRIELRIDAGADACADCLVSKEMMVGYVVEALREMSPRLTSSDVEVHYPEEMHAPGN